MAHPRLDERSLFETALMPLFTSEVIEVMRRTISGDDQDRVATAVIIKASKPNGGGVV
jgi:hypothetical protein